MFKSLRWQLTKSFVLLSAVVYLLLAVASLFIFYETLTAALDHELRALSAQVAHQMDMTGGVPHIVHWESWVQAKPFTFLGTVQIFDDKGNLLEQHGSRHKVGLLKGAPDLDVGGRDTELDAGGEHLRALTSPLVSNGKTIAYLQIMHATTYREQALADFALTVFMVAPLLLGALGMVGYVVAGRAVSPIERNYALLRQFMADAGHELTTPISIIQVNSETMEQELHDGNFGAESLLKRLHIIDQTSRRMSHIVQDLMFLAKTESTSVAIRKRPLQIESVISSTEEELAPLFKEKGIQLMQDTVEPGVILANSDFVKVAIANLLQNALRYTDTGGIVTLSCKNTGGGVAVSVKDSGIGIPAESLAHVFDRFYRVEKSRSRAQGGSGLGLAIVKAIADVHGGTVSVESTAGKGSTFTISLPA